METAGTSRRQSKQLERDKSNQECEEPLHSEWRQRRANKVRCIGTSASIQTLEMYIARIGEVT